MNLRPLVLGTVTANLALVGALLWQTERPAVQVTRARLALPAQIFDEVTNEPAPRPPEVRVPGSPPFHWSQIESTNHLVTLTNLLAVGCPKETVRDILDARVADDFRARLRELTRPAQARYWDMLAETGDLKDLFDVSSIKEEAEKLKAEKERVLDELESLLSREPNADKPGRNQWVAHLSEEKQAALAALDRRHAKEREELEKRAGKTPPADHAALAKELRTRHQAEHRAQFTDAEWDEEALRRSTQAQRVRGLHGFTATPEEVRSLARQLRDFDNTHPWPTPRDPKRPDDDPEYQVKNAEREAARKEHFLARLGEAGFAAFERGSDPRFHTLLKLARRLDLPAASAVQWLDLQSAAQEQARLIRANGELAEDARAVALLAIHAETERTLRGAVGAHGWGAYQRHAGDWLKDLRPAAP
jgi:hypothetical protein